MCGHHRHHRHGYEAMGQERHERGPRRPEERVGDAERAETLERLSEHFAAGRLTEAELDERSTQATEARTRGDLAALEADLPRIGARRGPRQARRRGAHAAVVSAVPCHAWWAVPVGLVVLF